MKLRNLLLGAAAAVALTGTAHAEHTGWYMSLGAGANWVPKGSVDEVTTSGVESSATVDWDTGWVVAGAIGYDFGPHWRAEFEVTYRKNDAQKVCTSSGCGPDSGTNLWELSQMVNVLYDFDLGGQWEAAVGAGVGGNLVVLNPQSALDGDSAGLEPDDYVLAGQLIGQVSYRISERWKAFADYHFMFMDDPSMAHPGEPGETIEVQKSDHSVMLGLRFDLQRDGMAPPPPAPTPAPAPKSPKQFIVFFGFNKSNLTPEASRVVMDAAAAAKEYGSASIMVVGHTDTVGSNSYNNALSMRRSQAVKDGLVAAGIAANQISTGGRGESELMVQTGDGVKEPQNRRATIDLN